MAARDILADWGVSDFREIDRAALQEITLGASILATGGGGDPEIGLLWALSVLEEGKEILLVDPDDMPDEALATIAGCLGAALVLTEKPPGGRELFWCYQALGRYLGKPVQAVVPPEAGGVNTPVPMAVAGAVGVPVIDADGMGRAFPELQMTSFYIHGVSPSPTVAADEKGHVTIADTQDALMAERIIRNAAMAYGGISWIAGYPMTGKELKDTAILHSISLAWELGRRVTEARKKHLDPVEEVLSLTKGYRAFQGKIVDINREFGAEKTKGFSLGRITMEGIEEFKGHKATIDFQNEWLTLRVDGDLRCMPPDLICILDPATGEPIRTDIVRYGYRGTVVLIPAHERMRCPKGIETFGPRYFGYDCDYVPVEELMEGTG
ncbi:DUF917 domain-containing protein [Candidatus Bipolaricaulota bacterium]|nr:DUF917 domain-containing protein [Candidatus Bipolaricaulota bacterium]